MNPTNPKGSNRLRTAMRHSLRRLRVYRQNRLAAIKQLVGKHYSEDGTPDRVPLNLFELAYSIYKRSLVAQQPQVTVSTKFRNLKPMASTLEAAINHLLVEIDLETTLSDAVSDAMFCMGVINVGMAPYATLDDPEVFGAACNVGQPFAAVVSLDDWVHDMAAQRYEQCAYAGHRYRLPYEYVMECGLFENLDKLEPMSKWGANDDFGGSQERAGEVSRGQPQSDEDEIYDYVELWNVWLPMERIVTTVVMDEERLPLRTVEWEGPERGPYHIFGFEHVSDQIMPLAPAMMWMDIHKLTNDLFLKVGRQADRQKTVLAYEGRAAADAKAIQGANDGDAINVDSVDAIKEFKWGGAEQVNVALILQLVNQFSWLAGNLDMLGGLSPQSETLGQDQLLAASASKRLQAMQAKVLRVTTDVAKDLAQYLWNDPLIELPLTKRIKDLDMDIPTRFAPELREGDFLQYNIKIEPHSMQYQTPEMKFRAFMALLQQMVLPMAQMLGQQGLTLDFKKVVAKGAQLNGLEAELGDILVPMDPRSMQTEPQPMQAAATKPPQTLRQYERINRPAGTRVGRDNAMMQTLLNSKVQKDEIGSVGRPG